MKKSIKKFEGKVLNNSVAVKGGGIGRGTRSTATHAGTRAELL
jgi:hypothetical protein